MTEIPEHLRLRAQAARDRAADREPTWFPEAQRCSSVYSPTILCSLPIGHEGNHKAHRSHVLTNDVLREWAEGEDEAFVRRAQLEAEWAMEQERLANRSTVERVTDALALPVRKIKNALLAIDGSAVILIALLALMVLAVVVGAWVAGRDPEPTGDCSTVVTEEGNRTITVETCVR